MGRGHNRRLTCVTLLFLLKSKCRIRFNRIWLVVGQLLYLEERKDTRMKPNNINGKLTRTGVIVLEVFALELHDEEAKKQFSKDREKVFRTLIEHEGIEINKLTLLKKDEMSLLRRSFGSKLAIEGNFHIVYPANERSGWICCCAD